MNNEPICYYMYERGHYQFTIHIPGDDVALKSLVEEAITNCESENVVGIGADARITYDVFQPEALAGSLIGTLEKHMPVHRAAIRADTRHRNDRLHFETASPVTYRAKLVRLAHHEAIRRVKIGEDLCDDTATQVPSFARGKFLFLQRYVASDGSQGVLEEHRYRSFLGRVSPGGMSDWMRLPKNPTFATISNFLVFAFDWISHVEPILEEINCYTPLCAYELPDGRVIGQHSA